MICCLKITTLNNKFNGWHKQTNLSPVTRTEMIYFECNSHYMYDVGIKRSKKECIPTYSLHSMQFCSIYLFSRVPDGAVLHKKTWFSREKGINQPLSVVPSHKIPSLDRIFCNQMHEVYCNAPHPQNSTTARKPALIFSLYRVHAWLTASFIDNAQRNSFQHLWARQVRKEVGWRLTIGYQGVLGESIWTATGSELFSYLTYLTTAFILVNWLYTLFYTGLRISHLHK